MWTLCIVVSVSCWNCRSPHFHIPGQGGEEMLFCWWCNSFWIVASGYVSMTLVAAILISNLRTAFPLKKLHHYVDSEGVPCQLCSNGIWGWEGSQLHLGQYFQWKKLAFGPRRYAAWNIAITLYWSTFKLCSVRFLCSVGSNAEQRMEEALGIKALQMSRSKVEGNKTEIITGSPKFFGVLTWVNLIS